MKRAVFIVLFVFLLVSALAAQEKSWGRTWNEMPPVLKRTFVTGFIFGAQAGVLRTVAVYEARNPEHRKSPASPGLPSRPAGADSGYDVDSIIRTADRFYGDPANESAAIEDVLLDAMFPPPGK